MTTEAARTHRPGRDFGGEPGRLGPLLAIRANSLGRQEEPDPEARSLGGETMTRQPKGARNLDGYGAPVIPWTKVCELLEEGMAQITQAPGSGGPGRHTCWLATVRPDGRPHVVPVGVLWGDGTAYFTAGPGTRKAKNLVHDPRCVITVATAAFDLVAEGEARKVTEEATLERVAEQYSGAGWSPTVRDGALYAQYSAPSAGPPPWEVYEFTTSTLFALGTAEPFGATRWRF